MKILLALAALSLFGGCASSSCSDGGVQAPGMSSSYQPCGMGCVKPDEKGNRKECRCSGECPCWKQHPR